MPFTILFIVRPKLNFWQPQKRRVAKRQTALECCCIRAQWLLKFGPVKLRQLTSCAGLWNKIFMGIDAIFNAHNWELVPFHFWSLCFFAFGSIVGSFLNVCIYRMPLDLSVVNPPSDFPKCKYEIT